MRSMCLVLFAAGAASLCGERALAVDEELVTVEGQVRYKGTALPEGTITFHLKNDQFVGAKIKDGKYRIDRVPIGEFKATIESKKNRLPQKYAGEDTSGLTVTAKKGKNASDYELTD